MEEDRNSEITSEKSNSKMLGEKRGSTHLGEKHEIAQTRVKMRGLESSVDSAEIKTHYPYSAKDKGQSVQWSFGEKEMSQVTEVPVTLDVDASQAEKTERISFPLEVNLAHSPLDLNAEVCCVRDSFLGKTGECVENLTKVSLSEKQDRKQHSKFENSKGINVDLNVEDVTSSINLGPAYSYKGHGHFKSRDVSESGSCTGPVEEKDPMSIWKEMKQNGFLSSTHGGIPMPKQRGRKSKNDLLKKKMELAKREQVNRFTKIAAPSGLLNELNPGIINHVRNRKQVHSIIEALVRSGKQENSSAGSKQVVHRPSGSAEVSKRDLEHMTGAGKQQLGFPHEEGLNGNSGSKQTRKYPVTTKESSEIMEGQVGDSETCTVERAGLGSCVSHSTHVKEDDVLALKLSSSTKASMSCGTLSNEESSNLAIVSSLSLEAATVASQWLELLHQDIKGRLSALRRSRRRVRSVITTELPFLIAKEFTNNQENDPYAMKISAELPTSKIADLHRARWTALFDQMDVVLAEEEKQLESWLNQVKEKQLLCDQGLHHVNWNAAYGLQPLGNSENDSRVWVADSSEKELAVNAAAASIYATCEFLMSQS